MLSTFSAEQQYQLCFNAALQDGTVLKNISVAIYDTKLCLEAVKKLDIC